MFTVFFSMALLFAETRQFQVDGQVVSSQNERFRQVGIESIDRRFVKYGQVDPDGKFSFKKIPEGLFKVTVVTAAGRAEQRTIEVRPSLADSRGRVTIKIELNGPAPTDQFKIGAAAVGVSPKARDELRRAYEARGDVARVRRHLEKAIEISPNFDAALNDLGTMFYRDGQFDKARELFQRALQANPNSYTARVNLGGAFISLGDYQHALNENRKALEMRPDDSLAQSQTGQALFHLKQYDEALIHLQAAKTIDPMSFSLPGIFIARIYEVLGDRPGAIAEYKEFLKVHPGSPLTTFVTAEIVRLER
jgi:tetratricopeptide (TPR) repeat protein